MSLRRKIFDIIQIGDKSNAASRCFDIFIVLNILLNIAVMFMETFEALAAYMPLFKWVEIVTTIIFCIEYVLRIWTADYLYPNEGNVMSRLKFIVSFEGVVDLFTILPAFFLSGFVVFRMLRVVRIFHLFRLNARMDSFHIITRVLYEKRNQLASSIFIILILMLASSLFMYNVEHKVQPEVFRDAFSGIWWGMSTLLTVGYGDIYPVTTIGKVMAIIIAFLGVGTVAIPTGIISAGFVEQYQRNSYSANYKELDIVDIVEIMVDVKLKGKSIAEVRDTEGLFVYLILRGNLTVLPKDETRLRLHDIIVAKILH